MSERTYDGVFIRAAGNGAPVVLLHGFPQTGDCWREVADRLEGRNRVLIPDLPGFGQSEEPSAPDARTVASVLLEALEHAGASRFVLVGHDFGGSVAFRMALDAPDRVEKLVVVNAPFRSLDLRHGWHMLALNLPILPEVALGLGSRWIIPWMIRAAAANKDAFDPERLQEYATATARRASSMLAYYRTITRAAIKKNLRSLPFVSKPEPRTPQHIKVPTLLVWGMRDPALPPTLIPTITRDIDDVRVVEIDEAGHFVPEEAPERLAHEIDHFVLAP